MDPEETEQREHLRGELLSLQNELERSYVPAVLEPMMSLRLTMQQLKVLTLLVAEPAGSTIRGLSSAMRVSLATMSGIVDRLETQDMIARTLDPSDQRVRRVTVTDAGRDTIQRLLAARPELTHFPLDRLALADLEALTQGIRALVAVMQEDLPG